jgi:hypothetical protein
MCVLLRLYAFNELGLLNPAEVKQAAKVFWSPVGRHPDLPWEPWGHVVPRLALAWPAPNGPSAADRVKQYILGQTLGAVHGGLVYPTDYFDLVLYATSRAGARAGRRRGFVTFTREELEKLFEKIRVWWGTYGRKQAEDYKQRRDGLMFDLSAFRRFMNRLWDMVRELIIPALRSRNS